MSIQEQFAEKKLRKAAPVDSGADFRLLAFPVDHQHLQRFATRRTSRHVALKRAFDIAVAVPLLALLFPLLLVLALAVKLDSKGPVLFRQQRLGLHGKPFRILKFRTMHVQEDGDDIRQAEPNDARVTAAGRFLRASSFDELPQLINVLRGEMSLVGPRPHAIAHDRQFGALIDNYALRRLAKPGITGWAQIHGLRGATPTLDLMRRRVDFDVWYARNADLLLDIEILVRTPFEMLRRRNAY